MERETRSQRLDGVVEMVDQRFKESQVAIAETQNAAALKLDGLTATINNLSTGLAGRIELLVLEMQVMKREMPPPGIHPSGVTNDEYSYDGRRAPTQVPSSWASMSAPHPGATQEPPQRAQEQPREHFNISSPLSGPSPTFGVNGTADPRVPNHGGGRGHFSPGGLDGPSGAYGQVWLAPDPNIEPLTLEIGMSTVRRFQRS